MMSEGAMLILIFTVVPAIGIIWFKLSVGWGWQLWHRLFGWHYIKFSFGASYSICRVHSLTDGGRYVSICGQDMDMRGGQVWGRILGFGEKYYPLTFEEGEANVQHS